MNSSALLRQVEAGDAPFFQFLRFLLLAGGILFLALLSLLPLPWPQQFVFGGITVALVLWLDRSSGSYLVTLTLLLLSTFSTLRYGYWRIHTTERFLIGSKTSLIDAVFILLLLFAETYAAITLFLCSLQTLWPLRRTPVALPDDPALWPAVDLLIPTADESFSQVRFTALAASNVDWPDGKLNVWILDDGNRPEFRSFAEEAGIGYITSPGNQDGRAGSLNCAINRLSAPYVAIFDCDHVPTRSVLQITLGWFLRDSKLGILQTPHHLDPPDRNPDQFRINPSEGGFLSSTAQDGNDFWNATFFCGSCAILRRTALDQIGGIATGTLTEGAHTSLRMQRKGWSAAFINIPQAAGPAIGSLSEHIGRRVRWARGMVQILRLDNPLFARGLSWAQRLCCFNAMTHFLYALPRLVFLTAPLLCLLFGRVNIPGYWAAIVAYALPHLVLSGIASSRIQGRHRLSLWNEIHETVLAPWILFPTLLSFLKPRAAESHEKPNTSVIDHSYFDRRTARPFLFLIAVNVLGILFAIPRLWQFPGATRAFPLNLLAAMHDGPHTGIIVLNLLWACYNLVILGVATSFAWESRQRRIAVRIAMTVPANVHFAGGSILHGVTSDLSTGGLMIRVDQPFTAAVGDSIQITLPVLDHAETLPATLVDVSGNILRAQFDALTLDQEEGLAIVLYSRADTWLAWAETREPESTLTVLLRTVNLALHGLRHAFSGSGKHEAQQKDRRPGKLATSIVPLVLVAVLVATQSLAAQQPSLGKPSAARVAALKIIPDLAANPTDIPDPTQTQIPDDLSLLPTPFLAERTDPHPTIQIVFLAPPSSKALEAAGIVSSWFGILANKRSVHFPVVLGAIPAGNAVILTENRASLPHSLALAASSGTIAMRTNPADPSSKLLILAADSPDGVLAAAKTLALEANLLKGSTTRISSVPLPDAQQQPATKTRWFTREQTPALPNLEIFATSGYPFTRKPNLEGAAIVLPDAPSAEEIELYLTIMGRFGAHTAHPSIGVSVTNPAGMTSDAANDYLVLGTVDDQPVVNRLNPSLPVSIDGSGLHVQDTQGFFAPFDHAWWKVRSLDRIQPSQLETAGGPPDALIEAIQWPRRSSRSVILILLHDKDAVPGLISALFKSSQSSDLSHDISQSVSVLDGSRFHSYRIGDDLYHPGSPSWSIGPDMFNPNRFNPNMLRPDILFADYPWLMVLFTFGIALSLALLLRSILRRKARARLQGDGWAIADNLSR